MERQKRIMIVLAGILAIALLAASIFHLGTKEAPVAPRSSAQTAPLPLSGRKVTVLTNKPHLRSAEMLQDWFREETGAVVRNLVVNYEDMTRRALEDISSASPKLDVFMFWYVDLGLLVQASALVDVTDVIEQRRAELRPEDFIPSLYDAFTLYRGRRWALPYDGDTHVLFYRKSLFARHRLSPPETWEDYLNAARTITEQEKARGIYGTAIMAPRNPMIIVSSFMNRLGSVGGTLYDPRTGPAVNSPEAVWALTAMIEQSRYALPTPMETDWEVSRDAFLSGRVGMVEQWTDIGVMAQDASQSLIQNDWGVVRMPRGSGNKGRHCAALNAGFSLGISAKAPDPETALAYLLFASRPDITLRLNLINGGIDPVRLSVLYDKAYLDFAPELAPAVQSAMRNASAWPRLPQAIRLLEILTDYRIRALEGQMSPQEALDHAQSQWRQTLEG